MSRDQLLADVRALRHYLGELLPSEKFEGNSVIANILSSIEGIAMEIPDDAVKRKYRIWFLYRAGTYTAAMFDSGATQEAETPEKALEDAHRRGIGWGTGYGGSFVKAVALLEELTSEAL